MDSPDYGGGAAWAHYCHGSKVQQIEEGGGRYIGGGRWSRGPDTDEPAPELPDGYYARRREQLIGEAMAAHEADCACMLCCVMGALEFKAIHYAAFSTDHRGSYSIERIIDHWMAVYVERGEEPVDLYDGESYEDAVAACQKHNDAPKDGL